MLWKHLRGGCHPREILIYRGVSGATRCDGLPTPRPAPGATFPVPGLVVGISLFKSFNRFKNRIPLHLGPRDSNRNVDSPALGHQAAPDKEKLSTLKFKSGI